MEQIYMLLDEGYSAERELEQNSSCSYEAELFGEYSQYLLQVPKTSTQCSQHKGQDSCRRQFRALTLNGPSARVSLSLPVDHVQNLKRLDSGFSHLRLDSCSRRF